MYISNECKRKREEKGESSTRHVENAPKLCPAFIAHRLFSTECHDYISQNICIDIYCAEQM